VTLEPQTAIYAGLALIVGSFLMSRLARARARTNVPDPRRRLEELREQKGIEDDLQELVLEIQELTRKNIAILDTKIRILQQLIVDADARIQALRGELPSAGGKPQKTALHQKVYEMADRGLDAHLIGRELGMERGEVDLILGLRNVKQ
jgi:hypothetical protein